MMYAVLCLYFPISLFLVACDTELLTSDHTPLAHITDLPRGLDETSGLASTTDTSVLVHNDSGNKPELYQISVQTGAVLHTTKVKGRKNIDWEELAEDSTYIYIGDFGNNQGHASTWSSIKCAEMRW